MLGALNPGLGLAILRLVLGLIFVMHGWPKLTVDMEMTAVFWGEAGLPFPLVLAWCITLLELGGGALLLVGYLVSPVCVLLIIQKTVGLFLIHLSHGFYVVGPSTGGIEFNLLLIAGLLTVLFAGPGYGTLQNRLQEDITVV